MIHRIADLGPKYILITDCQDVTDIARIIGITDLQNCSGLFVRLSKQGDCIEELWGYEGIIPLLDEPLVSLFP